MVNDPHEIILEHLRGLRHGQEQIRADLQDLKTRVAQVEKNIATLYDAQGNLHEGLASGNIRMDRIDARLERIEKRLDLVEA